MKNLQNIKTVSKELGVSNDKIKQLIKNNDIYFENRNGQFFVDIDEVRELISNLVELKERGRFQIKYVPTEELSKLYENIMIHILKDGNLCCITSGGLKSNTNEKRTLNMVDFNFFKYYLDQFENVIIKKFGTIVNPITNERTSKILLEQDKFKDIFDKYSKMYPNNFDGNLKWRLDCTKIIGLNNVSFIELEDYLFVFFDRREDNGFILLEIIDSDHLYNSFLQIKRYHPNEI